MKPIQRISLAMIVRNESTRIASCLESVKDIIDEIVIVDTGSTDETMQIAAKFTDKIYFYQWHNDFAEARNYAIEQTTGDWVLSLDADERLEGDSDILHSLINQEKYKAFCIPLCAQRESGDYLEYDRFMVLRLFKRNYRFKGAVHEYVNIDDAALIGFANNPVIWHTSVSASERKARRGRNISLIKKALAINKSDPYLNYYLGLEWLALRRLDDSIEAFKTALQQFSSEQVVFRSSIVRHLVTCYKNAGKLKEALCLCLEESQYYHDYCDIFFEAGVIFELLGEYPIAIKWLQESIRLGSPHIAFFHTAGTESYLAFYHLGYCFERLGRLKEAENCYEQALESNTNYYYPLYPLVLVKLTQYGADKVMDFLRGRGYLSIPEVAIKMAELFWTAGLPNISLKCLESIGSHSAASLELLARYQLYSSKPKHAILTISQIHQAGIEPSIELIVDEIVALMILDRFEEARERLLILWKKQHSRDVFRAVFCMYKKLYHKVLISLSNPKAAEALLELRDRCLNVRAEIFYDQYRFAAIINAIDDILCSEAVSAASLINDINEREEGIKKCLEYTFTTLRGIYQ